MNPSQTATRICLMNTMRYLAVLALVTGLIGCTSSRNIVITDGRSEARQSAEATQKIADEYRRAGAHEAAAQVQKQVNARRAEADRKYDNVWEWLVDLVLNSWLYSN
jgi:hypothetical protein